MALDSILPSPVTPPPPKPATSSSSSSSSSSNSSFGVDHKSDSSSSTHRPATHQSSSSGDGASKSDSGNTTRNSGQNSSSRNSASSSQSQNSSSSSQAKQSNSSTQTQSANSASNGSNGATQPNKATGPSFLQTLAQSQADAQDSVTATATATVSSETALTGKGKGKATKDDSSSSSASFGFLSQSLVAAMAGIQQPTSAAQGTTDSDESVDGVSLSSGTSAQSLVANLMQGTADELKATGADDAKLASNSAAAATTPTADPSAPAAASFQSHLGVSSQSQTTATQEAAKTQVGTSVGASGFADEVSDKITWMAHEGIQSASLQLTPEHMGPVEVRISVQEGSATVAINAAHPETRAALEQALPTLREMFSTQGLNLTDASVSQQFSRGQQQKPAISAVGSAGGASDEGTSAVVSVTSARLGLVDTYA